MVIFFKIFHSMQSHFQQSREPALCLRPTKSVFHPDLSDYFEMLAGVIISSAQCTCTEGIRISQRMNARSKQQNPRLWYLHLIPTVPQALINFPMSTLILYEREYHVRFHFEIYFLDLIWPRKDNETPFHEPMPSFISTYWQCA